jgi:hypothetical protein
MEVAKQFTAFLDNKPGRLAHICSALAKDKINIQALTVMDSKEHSVLRFVTDDLPKTRTALNSLGTPFHESDVLVVEMTNQPGALARVCEQLALEHINIDYAYCSSGAKNGRTVGIFRVANMAKAMKAIGSNGTTGRRQMPGRRPVFAR